VQTEGSALTRQGEMRLEALSESGKTRLLAFLEAAVPQMEHALAENEQSATFDDDVVAAAALEDDTARAPECVHALDPRPSTSAATGSGDATGSDARRGGATRDERFWRDLVPTGVSWNRSGFSLAVSYGRFDVTGWCDSPGALCVWNLRRSDVDPRKPDFLFETDSCLQCVAFHPADPAVVAAGSFDGEVLVWDIRGDGDGDGDGDGKENRDGPNMKTQTGGDCLVAKSAVSDASHREPVVALAWLRSAHAAGTRLGRGSLWTHDVCSFGSDGRVLVWDFSRAETIRGEAYASEENDKSADGKKHAVRRVPFPSFGYETRVGGGAVSANGGSAKSGSHVRGIAAASFFAAPGVDDGAPKTSSRSPRDTSASSASSASSSSSFLLGCDGGAVLECLMRHGAGTDAAAFARECAAGSVPAMRSPATAEYELHRGAAHGVCAHPSEPGVFLSCGADGSLKLYARRLRRRVARLEPRAGALFCAQWSPARPALAACGTSHGTVVLYDLLEGLVDERVASGPGGSVATTGDGVNAFGDASNANANSFGGGLSSLAPTAELRGCRRGTPTQALAFNPALPEYLAAADGTAVRVWDLGPRFAVPRAHEAAAVRALADWGEDGTGR
jgi:WD40 repeat protein